MCFSDFLYQRQPEAISVDLRIDHFPCAIKRLENVRQITCRDTDAAIRNRKLNGSLAILGKMKMGQHIDPDLFDIFIHSKVYLQYAQQHLTPQQIDIHDPSEIPGYPFL